MYGRNNIRRKFYQFLLPTLLSDMAFELNDFVDSILVAHLIDAEAMTLVNMGSPVIFVFSCIYCLLGVGGSAVFAGYLGRHESKKADSAFSVLLLTAVLISLLILTAGCLFAEPLSWFLCSSAEYHAVFTDYVRVLLLSGVLIIPVQVIITFMPALGQPGMGTFLNIAANVINLLMDFVLIRFCSMGLSGAAFATLSGYAAGLVIILACCATKKLKLPLTRPSRHDAGLVVEAASVGIAAAVGQIGFCIRISFSNKLAFDLSGMGGTMVFSVCIQTVSIVSIFMSGVIDAMIPIASSLYGQRDYTGAKNLIKLSLLNQCVANLLILLFFELSPESILAMYRVSGEIVPFAASALRVFSIMFLFRGFTLIYVYYLPIIGRKTYACLISAIDGFLGIIPLSILLTRFNGIDGLWQAYPVLAVLLLGAILVVNFIISKRSGGKYSRLLLLEHEEENVAVYECSVKMKSKEISKLSEDIQAFCVREGIDSKLSVLTALSVEEMGVFTAQNCESTRISDLDILLKIFPEYIMIDFRSIGKPFDTSSAPEEFSSLAVLKKVVSSMDYSYVLGMNQTRLWCRKAE